MRIRNVGKDKIQIFLNNRSNFCVDKKSPKEWGKHCGVSQLYKLVDSNTSKLEFLYYRQGASIWFQFIAMILIELF